MCSRNSVGVLNLHQAVRTEPGPPSGPTSLPSDPMLRAGDADRDRVGAVLSEALAAGYLTMTEFDERSDRVLAARTIGELDSVQSDLPIAVYGPSPQASVRAAVDEPGDTDLEAARRGVRAHVGSYLGVMALLIGIWLVVGLTAGSWYFWPIWPMLGWGVGIVGHVVPVLAGMQSRCGSIHPLTR